MSRRMSDLSSDLLSDLRDFEKCTERLASNVRQTVLEPFRVDPLQPESLRRPPPSPAEFRQMATKLGPLALKIAKQSIKSLDTLQKSGTSSNIAVVVKCLIDCTLSSLSSLRHMNGIVPLQAYEIEKITASLISRMVDFKEYDRALEEIRKFRIILADVVQVRLCCNSSQQEIDLNVDTQKNNPKIIFNKYQELFSFPLDSTSRDHTTILLVLSFQMNALRCWCQMHNGALKKFLADILNKPGNYYDWCEHLHSTKPEEAKKYLNWLYRLLNKVADDLASTKENALPAYDIQALALKVSSLSGAEEPRRIMERMVGIGVQYEKQCEKAAKQPNYLHLQQFYLDYLEKAQPDLKNLSEMDFYFVLCDYAAYVSRKGQDYEGTFSAYKYMSCTLQNIVNSDSVDNYYYAAYAANAKIALGSAQLNKMLANSTFLDLPFTLILLKEVIEYLQSVENLLQARPTHTHHTEHALYYLCQSIDAFSRSCKHLVKTATETKREMNNDPFKTPPRLDTNDFDIWTDVLNQTKQTLKQCTLIMAAGINLAKTKQATAKRAITISQSYVETMILLSQMQFKVHDNSTYKQAYEYLIKAEKMCSDTLYHQGFGYLASAYYNLGKMMIQANKHSEATSALKNSIQLLERDVNRANTTSGKLHLCKRYELYGVCCQAARRMDEAIHAYRTAMQRIPTAALKSFASKHDTTSPSTRMTEEGFLTNIIEKYLAVSVADPTAQSNVQIVADNFPSMSDFPIIQQCFILESELKVCGKLSSKMDLLSHQQVIIDRLLKMYDRRTYPIRRARILLDNVSIERKKAFNRNENVKQALACALDAVELLKNSEKSSGDDTKLLKYKDYYMGFAYSLIAINKNDLKEEIEPNIFDLCIRPWTKLLKDLHTVFDAKQNTPTKLQEARDKIDDVDQFYAHVKILSNFFGLHGDTLHQIAAMNLLLKLNNGLKPDTHSISESVLIAADIAKLYLQLGYTGKAYEEFQKIGEVVQKFDCITIAKVQYLINFAQYYITMDDPENSIDMYNEAKKIWQLDFCEDVRTSLTTLKAYLTQKMLFADIYSTISMYHSTFDKLDIAIEAATTSLRLLHAGMKGLEKSFKENGHNTLEDESFIETDPKTAKVVLRECQWAVAHKISSCCKILVNLYIRKGSWVEIEYLIGEIRSLADKTRSKSILFHDHLIASDFYLRYGDNEKASEEFNLARQLQPKEKTYGLDMVLLKISEANLAIAKERYEEATTLNEGIEASISNLLSIAYLTSLEDITNAGGTNTKAQHYPLDAQSSIPLQRLLNQNSMRTAMVQLKTGQVEKSLQILDQLIAKYEESSNVISNEVELMALIAHARLLQGQQKLSSAPHSRLFGGEASSLPAFKTQQRKVLMGRRTDAECDSKAITDNFSEVADDAVSALETGHKTERAALVHNLSYEAGLATFLKSQLAKDDQSIGATKSSYYLSMGNAVSMRRDIQACLKVKTNRFIMYRNSKITNEWPSIEEEDDDEEQKTTFLSLKRTTNPEWLQKHLRDVSDKYCNEYMLDAHQFQDEFIDILPSNWTVCSLTFDPESELLFAMQLRASESPLIFKLPLNRAKTRTGSKHSYTPYNYALSELKQIIQESDDTIFNSHNKDMTDPNVIAAWWDTRKKLDSRLKDLLRNMEEHWFSGFKGLLSGRAQESESELISFQQNFIKSAHNIVKERLKPQKKIEYSLNFCRMVLRLGSQPVAQDLEDIAFFILSTYEVPDELIDRKILEKLTKEVKTHIAQYYEMCRRQDIDATKNRPGEHVILILDKHLQMLPIESMPILRPQPASRLPSLSLLRDRILFTYANNSQEAYADFGVIKPKEWKDHTVSKKDAFYVLNPAGDLQETQKRLDPLLKSVPQWDGVTQKSPSEIECINALRTKDIYMYFGHGAGQSYLRGNMVKQLPICSTSLLMGCSSGLLKSNGEFDPYGYVLNYLVAGSPAVVANLWDVTDRSIDRLTFYMLSAWGLTTGKSSGKSLTEAVTEGRDHSGLTYLIGAAPVVYGIPVYVKADYN